MAYVPPVGSDIVLALAGAYTPPAGSDIVLNLGGGGSVAITVHVDTRGAVGNQRSLTADTLLAVQSSVSVNIETLSAISNPASHIADSQSVVCYQKTYNADSNAAIVNAFTVAIDSSVSVDSYKSLFFDSKSAVENQRSKIVDSKAIVGNSVSATADTLAAISETSVLTFGFDTLTAITNAVAISIDTLAANKLNVQAATPDFSVPWGQLPAVDTGPSSGWKTRRPLTTSIGMGWIKRLAVETKTSSAWLEKGANDRQLRLTSKDSSTKHNRTSRSSWRDKNAVDLSKRIVWAALNFIDVTRRNRSLSPGAKDISKRLRHDENIIVDLSAFGVPWGNPRPKDILHRTVWGKKYYQEICWRHYEPPTGDNIVFNLSTPITLVDDGADIRFRFDQFTYDRRCSWREPSGWRDAYFYDYPGTIDAGLWSSVYVMLNSAFLTRLPERTPVEIKGMTIATDWDSLYWTINATIGSDTGLALLEPTEDGPILVEASINGYLWNLQVDKWTTGESFGGKTRSIVGRSVSAQLGAPMAEIRTYTEAGERTAQQLMEYELENTGWSVTFEIDDWLVPGGVHCYQDQTPMQVIKSIADTCRAIVQTDMAAETINIKPRYKVPPWELDSTAADLIIPASMAPRIDGEWDERPFFNSVFVAGESGGISATVSREGSAGDRSAPMITGKLITATEPARALGIAVLGASGKWSKYRIELPVFASPDVPGIIQPGSIVEYNLGTSSWKGFVTAVSVAVTRNNGLKVRQTIDVERYLGT